MNLVTLTVDSEEVVRRQQMLGAAPGNNQEKPLSKYKLFEDPKNLTDEEKKKWKKIKAEIKEVTYPQNYDRNIERIMKAQGMMD